MPNNSSNISTTSSLPPKGRFAPSPSGRMHLGNVYAALMSWLSVKRKGGTWLLRIEDLDPQRSRIDYALQIEDDLQWLGLQWDEGGTAQRGDAGPYLQSQRGDIYHHYFQQLADRGLTYPCYCTRADILATQAPHESDGRVVYAGTCRRLPPRPGTPAATRLRVPDEVIAFHDLHYGEQRVNLGSHCGDFILRRKDGAWAYQLAVVVDDALMGVTEVVRGCDLLLSTPQQIYLQHLLGFPTPSYHHIPLLRNEAGERLSKRDHSLDMGELRRRFTAPQLLGHLAHRTGLLPDCRPVTAKELLEMTN
ncbi:MAG: tRNA glutamyl-Q(34) synthetase GluQRS [Bacteroidaceae bacterium]|nr:tRNA glutamyl-Q(34) synthetase GluQRS [Bacteroidaceae bacterium]